MFLTKTFHMIDQSDSEIASWAEAGDNFIVKNAEKFASDVLPQYFKHSNFSSFARQLNFYGFRKLKAEPILTADYDARTANHVRFYHPNFQRGRPELLCNIKRTTKSDSQGSDVEQLRMELNQAIERMSCITAEFDRKLTEISFEMNSKIAALHGKIAERDLLKAAQDRQIVASISNMSGVRQGPVPVPGDHRRILTPDNSNTTNNASMQPPQHRPQQQKQQQQPQQQQPNIVPSQIPPSDNTNVNANTSTAVDNSNGAGMMMLHAAASLSDSNLTKHDPEVTC